MPDLRQSVFSPRRAGRPPINPFDVKFVRQMPHMQQKVFVQTQAQPTLSKTPFTTDRARRFMSRF